MPMGALELVALVACNAAFLLTIFYLFFTRMMDRFVKYFLVGEYFDSDGPTFRNRNPIATDDDADRTDFSNSHKPAVHIGRYPELPSEKTLAQQDTRWSSRRTKSKMNGSFAYSHTRYKTENTHGAKGTSTK